MNLAQILNGPIVTEKSVRLQEANQHVFSVHQDATKIDVSNAIRTYYGVRPLAVRMLWVISKVRLVGRGKTMTKRREHKRAIVVLPKGKSLELLSVQSKEKKATPKAEKPVKKSTKKSSPSS